MDLKQLIIDTKSVWMDFPGLNGFEVEVANLSRKELLKLQKRCTITKWDRSARMPLEELDDDKFVEQFSKAIVKNWKGLTLDHLQTLLLIDTSGHDLSAELEYSKENAEGLVRDSQEFNTWLNEVAFNLDNFRDGTEGDNVEEA